MNGDEFWAFDWFYFLLYFFFQLNFGTLFDKVNAVQMNKSVRMLGGIPHGHTHTHIKQ